MNLRVSLIFAVVCGLSFSVAEAFSSLPKYLADGYKDHAEYKAFLETVAGLKEKCDVCHKPGAEKKAKGHGLNDFGKVYHDRFEHKKFSTAHKEMNTEEAMKLFKAAWEKSITEKNADGTKFIDLIQQGKLPGKND